MEEIKDRLRQLRKDLGYSQYELAEHTGIKQASISNYENGGNPNCDSLIKFAKTCGVSIDWILMGEETSSEHHQKHILTQMNQIKRNELWNEYSKLSRKYQKLLLSNLEVYLKADQYGLL